MRLYPGYYLRLKICGFLTLLIAEYFLTVSSSSLPLSASSGLSPFKHIGSSRFVLFSPFTAWIPHSSLPLNSNSVSKFILSYPSSSSNILAPCPRATLISLNNQISNEYSSDCKSDDKESDSLHPRRIPVLSFPGGGIYFYWQAGVIEYLREKKYDLSQIDFVGASAGALTSTLAACNVSFYHATDVAVSLCDKYNVWDRPFGLMGIWGEIVEEWLDIVLPDNAHELCTNHRVNIYILKVALNHRPKRIIRSHFKTREELIQVCLTSVHIPWFMNRRFSKRLINFNNVLHELKDNRKAERKLKTGGEEGPEKLDNIKVLEEDGVMERYIDGSFLLSNDRLKAYGKKYDKPTIIFDHKDNRKVSEMTTTSIISTKEDEGMQNEATLRRRSFVSFNENNDSLLTKEDSSKEHNINQGQVGSERKYRQADDLNRNSPTDMVTLLSPTGVRNLIKEGYQYAEQLDKTNIFKGIPKLKEKDLYSSEILSRD